MLETITESVNIIAELKPEVKTEVKTEMSPALTKRINQITSEINEIRKKIPTLKSKKVQAEYVKRQASLHQELKLLTSGIDDDSSYEDDMNPFDLIKLNAQMIRCKIANSLIITGDPGVGKSFTVFNVFKPKVPKTINIDVERLSENVEIDGEKEIIIEKPVSKEISIVNTPNSDYHLISGEITTAFMYTQLFVHKDKTIIFNDCDSVLKDPNAVNILKAATDTYPIREISRGTMSKDMFDSYGRSDNELEMDYANSGCFPTAFRFTGQVIYISNLDESKFDSAIISRSKHVNVSLTDDELIEHFKNILPDINPDDEISMKLEALNELIDLSTKNISKFKLDIRTLKHAIDFIKHFKNDTVTINGKEYLTWKKLLRSRVIKTKVNY